MQHIAGTPARVDALARVIDRAHALADSRADRRWPRRTPAPTTAARSASLISETIRSPCERADRPGTGYPTQSMGTSDVTVPHCAGRLTPAPIPLPQRLAQRVRRNAW